MYDRELTGRSQQLDSVAKSILLCERSRLTAAFRKPNASFARDRMSKSDRQRTLAGFDEVESPGEPATPSPAAQPQCNDRRQTPEDLTGKVVYVVDAFSLIFQVFHVMPSDMTSPDGQPTGAVHGFTRDILDILEKQKPDYLFCAFDAPGDTFRHELFDRYKIDREEMPEELRPQIPNIQRMLAALNVPVLLMSRYEADDIMATLAVGVEQLGGECFLVTSDKDCRQLITDKVKLFNIRKGEVFDKEALREDWGIRPDQVIDFQAMWGDSVDNVPGIEGIGKKTAQKLLEKYDSLEGVFEHIDELKGKQRERVIRDREQARLSRQLVRLLPDVPITVDWPAGRVGGFDAEQIESLCQEFGFRSLAERLTRLASGKSAEKASASYRTIATTKELAWLVEQLSAQKRFVLDTETTSAHPRLAQIVGYSFAWKEGEGYYVPVRAPQGDPQLDPEATRDALKPVLENRHIEKIGQNLKYDMVVLRGAGIELSGISFDTMVADYVLAPGERNHNMDDLAKRYLNLKTIKIKELIGTGKKQKRMDEVPVALVTPYAAEDADVPLRLYGLLKKRLDEEGLADLFANVEMPLIEVLAEIEFNGIKVDVKRLGQLGKKFGDRIESLREEIFALAGEPFNIDSPKQLAEVLFDRLDLPVIKKTKTGRSTDVEVLTELARSHELPAKVVEYRQYAKLKSTYVDALAGLAHPQTGRVHTSFQQDVAATGRLSSKDPNLQNIPIRTEAGREIRSAFLAGHDGWQLLTADYSQIELRVLAHFSGDEALRRAFAEDRDIHATVAAQVYGVLLDEVTSAMRRSAKAINFGIIYGQSPFGLAKALGIEQEDAAQFIDAYFAQYPGVDAFLEKILAEAREQGFVSTILGRRRSVQGVRDSASRGDKRQRNLPERIAINTVIQGSAADLIKQAMISIHRRLQSENSAAKMLLQIHDELVFEAPQAEIKPLAALVGDEMSGVGELTVPLKVDVTAGQNWADCRSLEM